MPTVEKIMEPVEETLDKWAKFFQEVDEDIGSLKSAESELDFLIKEAKNRRDYTKKLRERLAKLRKIWG